MRPKKCLVSGNVLIIKIIKNTLKIEEKFSDVPKKFRVGPKKVWSVGFPETRFFLASIKNNAIIKSPVNKPHPDPHFVMATEMFIHASKNAKLCYYINNSM